MDNGTAERLIQSNQRLIEALGMHWANQEVLSKGEPLPYTEGHFHNVAYAPL